MPASKRRSVKLFPTFTESEARKMRAKAKLKKMPLDEYIRWKVLK